MTAEAFRDCPRLPQDRPATAGILHLGLGNFHRAHQAVYTAAAVEEHPGEWGIVGVASRSHRVVDPMRDQELAYSVITMDSDDATAMVLNIHTDVMVAAEDAERVLDTMARETIKIISLTVSEEGYSYSQRLGGLDTASEGIRRDLAGEGAPETVIGQLAEGLRRRFLAHRAPVAVMSCDNLAENGRLTRALVREFIQVRAARGHEELLDWLDESVRFPSTMVDRIVPSTEERHQELAFQLTGYRDAAPVPAEPFTMWVIEDDFPAGRPRWEVHGAVLTDELLAYELMKLRILNASNSMYAYLGLIDGLSFIAESAARAGFREVVEKLMRHDMLPTFEPPSTVDTESYIAQTLGRFANRGVAHRTTQVGSDGSNKLPVRITEPVLHHHRAGQVPEAIALLAALYIQVFTNPGSYDHVATGRPTDPRSQLLADLGSAASSSEDVVRAVLIDSGIFPPALAEAEPWIRRVVAVHELLATEGVDAAIRSVVKS